MKPTHDELNSLVTLCTDEQFGLCIGLSDVLYTGQPCFRVYQSNHAYSSEGYWDVDMRTGELIGYTGSKQNMEDGEGIDSWTGCITDMCSRSYPIHGVCVWDMIKFV